MTIKSRINYFQRIFTAYVIGNNSQLTFFHEKPDVNADALVREVGQYYMSFLHKANYPGPFDNNGIPLIDYQGVVGKQYCSIAISQYGLGHYNLYRKTGNKKDIEIAIKQADWLIANLEKNNNGVSVWMHHFNWEYRDTLKSPWYSALAQGNGISLLLRVYLETKNKKYLETTQEAFRSLLITINRGGMLCVDKENNYWLEETIVDPPTHILNGFLWTLFGVWDYWLFFQDQGAKDLFDKCVEGLKNNLKNYDIGFWSLYEQSGTRMKMMASPFYHSLHIIQLRILYKITNEIIFSQYAEKWEKYRKNWFYRNLALTYKIIFKILYY